MAWSGVSVINCDGHLVESIPKMAEYMGPSIQGLALRSSRQPQRVYPSLDGYHYPGGDQNEGDEQAERVRASEHWAGSGVNTLAFVEKSDIADTFVFPSEGLSVGNIGLPDYAVRVCRAYNDYIADRFLRLSPRIHPMELIPMQDVSAAAQELRRGVRVLDLSGAMVPIIGLPLHLGHDLYWLIYKEAADLGCAPGIHGGANVGIGKLDTFQSRLGARLLWHPVPLMEAMTSFIVGVHGVSP